MTVMLGGCHVLSRMRLRQSIGISDRDDYPFTGSQECCNPGVWVFPKLLVCLDCGFARFTVQRAELALLADGLDSGEQICSGQRFDNVV